MCAKSSWALVSFRSEENSHPCYCNIYRYLTLLLPFYFCQYRYDIFSVVLQIIDSYICRTFMLFGLQEIAVKRFLDQDISGESLEEFKTEVHAISTSPIVFLLQFTHFCSVLVAYFQREVLYFEGYFLCLTGYNCKFVTQRRLELQQVRGVRIRGYTDTSFLWMRTLKIKQ